MPLNRLTRAILCSAIVGVCALPAHPPTAQAAPAPATRPAAEQQAVPVKEVVLFTSGVGYFEHFGSVQGDGATELHFKADQINDILKSLLLEDLDGGKVAAVTYGSQGPLAHTLKSFQVDLSASPPLSQLLSQLRGATVTASLPAGPVTGQILSVEKKQKPVGDKALVDAWVLDLLMPGGSIRPVELEAVSEVKLDDPKLQQELVKALSAVAAARDQDSKPVSIRFSGQGQRRVRIGYVVEAPVWKASYRLVLGDDAAGPQPPSEKKDNAQPKDTEELQKRVHREDIQRPTPAEEGKGNRLADDANLGAAKGSAKLQGWAIIENQTDGDWENVQLSLVSGRPISFIEDLYQPLFVPRPVIEPELYASLRPQRYLEGLSDKLDAGLERQEAEKAGNGPAQSLMRARRDYGRNAAFGAGGGAMAPAGAVTGLAAAAADRPMDATRSVSALASGAAVGEFFQYTVGDVTLPRQKSAMIPIVTDSVRATRRSIYNASVFQDHPLLGARLTNTTGKLLPQGPITVLDGGAYAGDATIEDLPAGQNRLISYGIDQQLLVHSNDQSNNSALVTAKLVKGVLELTHKQTFRQVYDAQNKGKTDRNLLIEHPRRQGWTLVEPAKATESTDALYRFDEPVAAGKTQKLTVREELVSSQGIALLPMDTNQIEVYLRTGEIPPDVKKALAQAAKLKYALVDTQRQTADRQQQIAEITAEQTRIRENMKAVAQNTDYYQRLLKELDTQETQIQKLSADLKDLRQKQQQQQKDLENYLGNLSVG